MSLISQLLALVAAMGAFLILIAIMRNTAKNYNRIQTVVAMIEAETRLISYFQNYEVLKSYANELKAGKFSNKDLVLNSLKIGRIGAPLYLTQDGVECGNSTEPLCRMKIETAVQCSPMTSGAACRAAYRISSLKDSTPSLGAQSEGPFTVKDYVIPIPYELSMRGENDSCNPGTDMFAAGMSRESGKMWCLRKPQKSCASGEIAKGLKYNAANGSLEPICHGTQTLRCPANYVLSSFKISSLESGQTKSGECVFVTKKEVPWKNPPAPASSVSGTYCPKFYKTKATCSVTVTSQWKGACPYSCNCDKETGKCSTCYSASSPSNVGSYTLNQGSDQTASCSINPGTQSCGAGWTGVVNLTGSCVLTAPEKVGVL